MSFCPLKKIFIPEHVLLRNNLSGANTVGHSWPIWLLVVVGLLVFSPLLDGGTTHLAVMIIRLTILLLLAVFLTQVLCVGKVEYGTVPLGVAISGFLGLAVFATVTSPYVQQSVQWLIVLLSYTGVLYLVVYFLTQWDHVVIILSVLVVMGLVESGVAISQVLLSGATRPTGTFFNPNFLAGYVVASWTVVLGYLCYLYKGNQRGKPRKTLHAHASYFIRLSLGIFLLGIFLSVLVWTGSRGGILAACLGTFLIIWLRFGKKGAGILLVIFLMGVVLPSPLHDRVLAEHGRNPMGYARLQMWQAALRGIADHPLGIGLGLYQYVAPRYAFPIEENIARYGTVARTPHNEYLQMGVELGVASLVFFGYGLWVIFHHTATLLNCRLKRGHRGILVGISSGVVALFVHAAVDSVFHEPAIAIVLILFVGILLASPSLLGVKKMIRKTVLIPFTSRLVWAIIGIIFMSIMSVVVLRLGFGWLSYHQGSVLLAHQRTEKGIEKFQTAIYLDPGKALYHSALAAAQFRIFEDTGNRSAANLSVEELQRAIELNPIDGRLYGLLGRVYRVLGESYGMTTEVGRSFLLLALSAYERTTPLEPFSPFHRFEAAHLHSVLGNTGTAQLLIQEAVAIEPNFLPGREWLARHSLGSGNFQEALLQFQEIVKRNKQYAAWQKTPFEKQFFNIDLVELKEDLKNAGLPI